MEIDTGLKGKVAIVTGGSEGIGRACATELAKEGVKVALCAKRLEGLKEVAGEINRSTGSEVLPIQADMSVEEDIKRCVQTAAEHFGRVDILINNAADFGPTSSHLSKEAWENHFRMKVLGYLRTMRETVPHMVRGGNGGRIVNIAGIAARESSSDDETAGGVNAAIVNMTKGVAEQYAKENILVNAIHPGTVRTERHEMNPQTIAAIPIGRMVEPEEVAYLAVYLCSDLGKAISGQAMAVDGGQARAVSY